MDTIEQAALKIDFLKKMLGSRICIALETDDITEIMANPDGSVCLESREKGLFRDSEIGAFESQNFLLQLARIQNTFLNKENPYKETRLPFHQERLAATILPITERATFTIRKPAKYVYSLAHYLN